MYDKLLKPWQSFWITLYIYIYKCITTAHRTSWKKTLRISWSIGATIYCYLKCIIYDKLLKPRQSFWITLYIGIHVLYPLFLSEFNEIWISVTYFRKILKYQILWNFVQWEPSCFMRTDRRTDTTTLIVAFRWICERAEEHQQFFSGNFDVRPASRPYKFWLVVRLLLPWCT